MKRIRKSSRAVSVLTLLILCATPALAGHGHHWAKGHGKHGRKHAMSLASQSGNSHSNKGGTLRGLKRANNVAGAHGAHGRTNAGQHGKRSNAPFILPPGR
jgi:hypothetical protein